MTNPATPVDELLPRVGILTAYFEETDRQVPYLIEMNLAAINKWPVTMDIPIEYLSLQEHQAAIARAGMEGEERGFQKGIMHRSVPRGRVSVHGTDGCLNCETGRITIFAASRYCLDCEVKQARASGEAARDGKGGGT